MASAIAGPLFHAIDRPTVAFSDVSGASFNDYYCYRMVYVINILVQVNIYTDQSEQTVLEQ